LGVAALLSAAVLMAMTPQQKAALVVVSGLPAPAGVAGVLVQRWDRSAPRPAGALVFVDQEGGEVRAFPQLPPAKAARAILSKPEAFAAGEATATPSASSTVAPPGGRRGPHGPARICSSSPTQRTPPARSKR
jgi:hypothetical protein